MTRSAVNMRNWHFSNFYFFYFTTVGVIVPYWSLYLQYKGFSAAQIGQLMAILLMTKVIAPNNWATIADNVALKKAALSDFSNMQASLR